MRLNEYKRKTRMRGKCRICQLSQLKEVNEAIRDEVSLSMICRWLQEDQGADVTHSMLNNHKKHYEA